jgi:hypothetical protein
MPRGPISADLQPQRTAASEAGAVGYVSGDLARPSAAPIPLHSPSSAPSSSPRVRGEATRAAGDRPVDRSVAYSECERTTRDQKKSSKGYTVRGALPGTQHTGYSTEQLADVWWACCAGYNSSGLRTGRRA